MKSISVENLEDLVERMVNGTLGNDERVTKFHQMIYEECYFKKLFESKGSMVEQYEIEPSEYDKQSISATVEHRRSRRPRYRRVRSRSSIMIDTTGNKNTGKDFYILQIKSPFRTSSTANAEDRTNANDTVSDSGAEDDVKVIEIWNSSNRRSNDKEKTNKITKRDASKEDRVSCNNRHNNGSPASYQNREKLSFEAWKKRKTIAYRRILEDKEREKQRRLIANLASVERKKIARQEQIWKKELRKHQQHRKLSEKYFGTVQRPNQVKPNCKKIKEKLTSDRYVNNALGKRDGVKQNNRIKRMRISTTTTTTKTKTATMQKFSNIDNIRRNKTINFVQSMEGATFDNWLNQLNWTLHKKYMRERRHLVRSFYCQPVYYGS